MTVHLLGVAGGPLPRGRNLDRDEVLASQRSRILIAITEAIAERGYAGTTVTDVIARARVSRATFYDSFDNKDDCFVAAYEAATDVLSAEVARATAADRGGLRETLGSAMRTYCALLAANPGPARALIVESAACPAIRTARSRGLASWAQLLETLALERRPDEPVPAMAGTAAIGAVVHLLGTAIEEDRDLAGMSDILADSAYRLLTRAGPAIWRLDHPSQP